MFTTKAAVLALGMSSVFLAGASVRAGSPWIRSWRAIHLASSARPSSYRQLRRPTPTPSCVCSFGNAPARSVSWSATREALTLLRDDGQSPDHSAHDGLYAGLVRVNAEQYSIEQRRRLNLAETFKEVPLIEQRRSIGSRPFRPSKAIQLAPDVATRSMTFRACRIPVDSARELVIRHVSVVEDNERTFDACTGQGKRMGAWTFGRLITEMANRRRPVSTRRFRRALVQSVARGPDDQQLRCRQRRRRRAAPPRPVAALPGGQLDVAEAPFRLLAIVNRLDFRESVLFSKTPSGGELRSSSASSIARTMEPSGTRTWKER